MKQDIRCKLGFHDWAKCIGPGLGLYLYGQKFCIRCKKQACGYTEKEIDKAKSLQVKSYTDLTFYRSFWDWLLGF